MKATKKQIEEVTAKAIEMNFSIELALRTLSFCSASMYKSMGAEGVVNSSINSNSSNHVDVLSQVKYSNANYISRIKNQ